MKATTTPADRAVRAILRNQADLIARSQALAAGLSKDALRHRVRADGPWRAVLPGIYLSHDGGLTAGQREMAAVLYAGGDSVITGPAALRRLGVRVPLSETIDVLIPATSRRASTGFVQIHRTYRMPERPWRLDGIRWAPPARAVADATRGGLDPRDARDIVAAAIQKGACSVEQLSAELQAGPSQSSQLLRSALEEAIAGVASVAEGDLRALIKRAGIAEPLYNPRLYAGEEFLASPDAWWPDAGVACEVDSREWHLSPSGWERTQARHAKMTAHGILVLHYAPRRIRSDPAGVAAEIRRALQEGRRRPPPPIRTVSSR